MIFFHSHYTFSLSAHLSLPVKIYIMHFSKKINAYHGWHQFCLFLFVCLFVWLVGWLLFFLFCFFFYILLIFFNW